MLILIETTFCDVVIMDTICHDTVQQTSEETTPNSNPITNCGVLWWLQDVLRLKPNEKPMTQEGLSETVNQRIINDRDPPQIFYGFFPGPWPTPPLITELSTTAQYFFCNVADKLTDMLINIASLVEVKILELWNVTVTFAVVHILYHLL